MTSDSDASVLLWSFLCAIIPLSFNTQKGPAYFSDSLNFDLYNKGEKQRDTGLLNGLN